MTTVETEVADQLIANEEEWMKTFSSVRVQDINDADVTERKTWMFLLYSPSKFKLFARKKPSQWGLMVQYHDGQKTVRYVFTAEQQDGKIVAVRTDYLEAEKWKCKFLDTIDVSPKDLVAIALANPLNGADFGKLTKKPRQWTHQLCEMINHNFVNKRFWNKSKFEKFTNVVKLEAKREPQSKKEAKTKKH